jgi:LacI family transcriptional regulator
MGNVTIKMLAKELNLSTAAISKALRDSHEISEATKLRVRDLATKLDYTPNPYAGSLRRKKSKTIAVVLPEVADSFFSIAINGIEEVAIEKDYHVLIYLSHENYEREKAILKTLHNGRVDGVLLSISSNTTDTIHIQDLCNKGVPLVFFDRACNDIDTATVTTNDYESGYAATQHLIDNGCLNIAILSISSSLAISTKRMEGYQQALADNGIMYSSANHLLCSNDIMQNTEQIKKLLLRRTKPDGIIATVEKLTTCVYAACKDLKLNIPNDIKIVSFSNQTSASILAPSLTTITQPAFEMGKASAAILFKALQKNNHILKNQSKVIPSILTVRESSIR